MLYAVKNGTLLPPFSLPSSLPFLIPSHPPPPPPSYPLSYVITSPPPLLSPAAGELPTMEYIMTKGGHHAPRSRMANDLLPDGNTPLGLAASRGSYP